MKHAREDYNRIQDPDELIPLNEPVFLIRGQDLVGPSTLRFYAAKAKSLGADQRMIDATLRHAARMESWQKAEKGKVPDMPNSVKADPDPDPEPELGLEPTE